MPITFSTFVSLGRFLQVNQSASPMPARLTVVALLDQWADRAQGQLQLGQV